MKTFVYCQIGEGGRRPETRPIEEGNMFISAIDILETRSSPHKGTAIADITSKMITEMA